MGCAFAACLERKQKREKECGVTATFDANRTTFTREGSFRVTTATEAAEREEVMRQLQDAKKRLYLLCYSLTLKVGQTVLPLGRIFYLYSYFQLMLLPYLFSYMSDENRSLHLKIATYTFVALKNHLRSFKMFDEIQRTLLMKNLPVEFTWHLKYYCLTCAPLLQQRQM